MQLTTTQSTVLAVVIDRLIPGDDGFPSATGAGVTRFLHALFGGDRAGDVGLLTAGLDGLDAEALARHGMAFSALSETRQDAVLSAAEAGDVRAAWAVPAAAFFDLLLNVSAEGYYADTADGHVPDSWRMLGYDPGANRP